MTDRSKGALLAFAGVCILSPDSLLVRMLDMEQWTMLTWRGAGLAVGLAVFMLILRGRKAFSGAAAAGAAGLGVAIFYSGASILFVTSLYHTTVANTLALINTAPLFAALMTRFWLKERLPRRTWIAILLCLVAIGVIVGGDVSANPNYLEGDFMALGQALCLAATFVLIRSKAQVNTLPYMALGGVIVALASAPLAGGAAVPWDKLPLLMLLVLGVLPVSFAMLFVAPRYISAPEVNMTMLLEMLLAPLLVWALLGEKPPTSTLAGGAVLMVALFGNAALGLHEQRRAHEAPRLG
ncbi:MAG: DMT family transporter [Desulfovibrionaceae bacterium]